MTIVESDNMTHGDYILHYVSLLWNMQNAVCKKRQKKKCLQLNVCTRIELEGMSMCAVFGWDLICFEVFLSGKSSVTTKSWHRVFQIFRIIKKSMCPTEIDDALWCFRCVCSCSLFSLTDHEHLCTENRICVFKKEDNLVELKSSKKTSLCCLLHFNQLK